MIFVIGGYAQGKTEYVKREYKMDDECFYTGDLENVTNTNKRLVINHFNDVAYEYFLNKTDILPLLNKIILDCSDCIIISTEIGNGIVPVDKEQREYREWMGRIQTYIASKAQHVVRVTCGIGQIIK